ncbi:baseplate J/gp47 family protein [Testudinibacter sp. P27/CKL/0425]
MAYQSPTLSQLIKQGEQQFQHRLPNLRRNNVVTVINRICAALSAGEHMHIDWLARQIIPTTADEDYLIEYCLYKGIVRKQATTAEGVVIVDVANNSEIPEGTVFQHALTGLNFIATTTTAVTAGKQEIAVKCEVEGSQGNVDAESAVNLTSAILGVKSTAMIKSMSGGTDIESLSSLLSRLIYRVQYPPAGGADHDYVRWATEVPGVTRAWCYPRHKGGGTVGVAFVMEGQADILPAQEDCARVHAYISGHKNEVTGQLEGMPANVELFVFAPQYRAIDFELRINPDSETLRKAVKQSLSSYLTNAGTGATLYLSQIRAAVSNTAGETDNNVLAPATDIKIPSDTIPVLGAIVWR